ncbi:Uncharacterized protein Fot_56504 [Forsythia ovata]|uniref:Uncharacterized protein n=1 Tax=Forsythia ovata TaxID=205694 RepID=A0ABD1NZP6_9LAMI
MESSPGVDFRTKSPFSFRLCITSQGVDDRQPKGRQMRKDIVSHGDTRIRTDVRGEESQTLEELNRSSSGKKSIKTTDRNDPDQDTAVQSSLETIGCPSASNRFASLQTEEDTHEVDEFGEELLQGAEGT